MNAELLHDALNYLPNDLITAADQVRSQPRRRVVPWRRYASLAACLILVLCGTLLFRDTTLLKDTVTTESAAMNQYAGIGQASGAPQAESPAESGADGAIEEAEDTLRGDLAPEAAEPEGYAFTVQYFATPFPERVCIDIHSEPRGELIRSRQELTQYLDANSTIFEFGSLLEACEGYDDAWFEAHTLILLRCPMTCYTPISLTQPDNAWVVTVHAGPAMNATACHVVMEIDQPLPEGPATVEIVVEIALE